MKSRERTRGGGEIHEKTRMNKGEKIHEMTTAKKGGNIYERTRATVRTTDQGLLQATLTDDRVSKHHIVHPHSRVDCDRVNNDNRAYVRHKVVDTC